MMQPVLSNTCRPIFRNALYCQIKAPIIYKTHYFGQHTGSHTYKKRLSSTKKLSICITALSMYFLCTLSDLFRRSVKWRSRYAFQCHCTFRCKCSKRVGDAAFPPCWRRSSLLGCPVDGSLQTCCNSTYSVVTNKIRCQEYEHNSCKFMNVVEWHYLKYVYSSLVIQMAVRKPTPPTGDTWITMVVVYLVTCSVTCLAVHKGYYWYPSQPVRLVWKLNRLLQYCEKGTLKKFILLAENIVLLVLKLCLLILLGGWTYSVC
jgi:hypothetical protein